MYILVYTFHPLVVHRDVQRTSNPLTLNPSPLELSNVIIIPCFSPNLVATSFCLVVDVGDNWILN